MGVFSIIIYRISSRGVPYITTAMALKRIQRELQELGRDPPANCSAGKVSFFLSIHCPRFCVSVGWWSIWSSVLDTTLSAIVLLLYFYSYVDCHCWIVLFHFTSLHPTSLHFTLFHKILPIKIIKYIINLFSLFILTSSNLLLL